jgi:hypothetical protein
VGGDAAGERVRESVCERVRESEVRGVKHGCVVGEAAACWLAKPTSGRRVRPMSVDERVAQGEKWELLDTAKAGELCGYGVDCCLCWGLESG